MPARVFFYGIIKIGGGVAQLARACVLYTQSPWFEPTHPYQTYLGKVVDGKD